MNSVSSVDIVNTSSYQGACPHSINAAMIACTKAKEHDGVISHADVTAINDAVEPVLASSAALAVVYCKGVLHIVCWAGADEENRIAAGVATIQRVLLAMTLHVEDADVQEEGACALAYLAYNNSVNLAGMLALGGLQTLITAADAHIASEDVQNYVCMALYCIARDSADERTALRASRAADVATRAQDLYPDLYYHALLLKTLEDTLSVQ